MIEAPMMLYVQAINHNDTNAMIKLGKLYLYGYDYNNQGIRFSDNDKAKEWFNMAANKGNKEAKQYLLELERKDNK